MLAVPASPGGMVGTTSRRSSASSARLSAWESRISRVLMIQYAENDQTASDSTQKTSARNRDAGSSTNESTTAASGDAIIARPVQRYHCAYHARFSAGRRRSVSRERKRLTYARHRKKSTADVACSVETSPRPLGVAAVGRVATRAAKA